MSSAQKSALKSSNETINKYMPLVKSIARRISIKLPKHYDIEDLVSDGVVGLLSATERFDPTRGVKFETFATYYIKGAILDNLPKIPTNKTTVKVKPEDHLNEEEDDDSNSLSSEEVESESNLLYNKITQMTYSYILSLDAPSGGSNNEGEDNYSLLNQLGSMDSVQNDLEFEDLQDMLRLAIEQLPMQERTTLKYYYFNKMPFNEIGKKLGLSESWVSRIHKRALEQLRNKIGKKKSLDDFISSY